MGEEELALSGEQVDLAQFVNDEGGIWSLRQVEKWLVPAHSRVSISLRGTLLWLWILRLTHSLSLSVRLVSLWWFRVRYGEPRAGHYPFGPSGFSVETTAGPPEATPVSKAMSGPIFLTRTITGKSYGTF